ncbi:transporter substrate-binding domain-containing protein [Streptomyces sp. NPDC006971]|uniref:transporter substrate-binding domain-containing protein n=1 Tax=Streptomyces sp. NPDC006971 TaxID=3154784 RepID=UPI0033C76FF1
MTSKLSRVALACCGTLLLATSTGCGSDEWPQGKKVRISVKADQPGTGYQEGKYGPRTGFDIDIARVAAEALGKEPDFSNVASDKRDVAIGEGDADLVVATFSINDDRLSGKYGPAVDFVGPYAKTSSSILVREEDYSDVQKTDDLEGRKVCTWPGTTSGVVASENLPTHESIEGTDAGDCVNKLNQGDVDAVFTDALLLHGFTKVYPNLQVVDLDSGNFQYYGIALPKGHRDVCEKIKAELKKYVGSHDWAQAFRESLRGSDPVTYQPAPGDIDKYSCRDEVGR